MYHHATCTILALAHFLVVAVVGQIVSPFATHDCSSETVYTGDTACNNDLSTCCSVGGTCCAGGCCPELAICVFMGTANEACCSTSDPTLCGSDQPTTSQTCPNPAGPSVPCSGVGSSWYCAAGCTCDVSIDDGCNCFSTGGSDCSDDGGSGDSSSAAASTEPAAAPTTTAPLEGGGSSVDGGSGSGAQTTAGGGGAAGGGAATTAVSSAAVPAGSTKAGAGRIRGEVVSGVGLGLLVVGVGLVL